MLFCSERRCAGLTRLVVLAVLAATSGLCAAQAYLPKLGGRGGGQFTDLCPADMNLTGFELRAADDVDAIRPICSLSYGRSAVGPPRVSQTWRGGNGGRSESLRCPARAPIISGIAIITEGVDTVIVNTISLYCSQAGATEPPAANPSAVFEGPAYVPSKPALGIGISGDSSYQWGARQDCPTGQVAIGVHGRAGKWLDAMGLVCDAPRMTAGTGVASIGRVGSMPAPGAPETSICDAAKAARARGSPAAANLEAQCQAQTPVGSIGRVVAATPPGGTPESICDRAGSARDRKSPAAASLAEQCIRLGGRLPEPASTGAPSLEELMAKGQAMVNANALAADLRARQPAGPVRDGFDIGIAVTDADTAWGPGKQKILDALPPPQQEGFKLAASLALDQNRNAELAQIGASIAEADPLVAQARSREQEPRFRLGFDIASGLFGNPALGSKGNTAAGPGAMRIRDALSTAAQRGFTASMQLHLSRRY